MTAADMPSDADERVLVGRAGEGQLTFGPPQVLADGYLRIPTVVESVDVRAELVTEEQDRARGPGGLVGFFEGLAANWRGWAGSRDWFDSEDHIRLSATHDGKGTISIRVDCRLHDGTSPGSWRLHLTLGVDPGSLDATVEALRLLLQRDAPGRM